MRQFYGFVLLLIVCLSGCSMSFGADVQVTLTIPPSPTAITPTIILSPTVGTPNPTITPHRTQTPTPRPLDASNTGRQSQTLVGANCETPIGWETYTVKAGDTLYSIALAATSNVNELITANCLADANRLTVGQQLLLPPGNPATLRTITPTLTPVPQQDNVVISDNTADNDMAGDEIDMCGNLFFTPTFDTENGWCTVESPFSVTGVVQKFERGYMVWRSDTSDVYILRRDSTASSGGLSEVLRGRAFKGTTLPTPLDLRYLPDQLFLPYWYQVNNDHTFPDIGWATTPASEFNMQIQPIDRTGWTSSALSWGPRFFINWSLGTEVLAIGNRTWNVAGHVGNAPVGTSRAVTQPYEPAQIDEPHPPAEITDEPSIETTEEPVTD